MQASLCSLSAVDTETAVARGEKGGIILIVSVVANTGSKDHVNNVSLNFFKKVVIIKATN